MGILQLVVRYRGSSAISLSSAIVGNTWQKGLVDSSIVSEQWRYRTKYCDIVVIVRYHGGVRY